MAGALNVARQVRYNPGGKPYIDWTNPITYQLAFCWFFPYGDLTGYSRLSASSAFTPIDSPYGKSGNDAAGSSYESWTLGAVSNTTPTSALVSGCFKYNSAATYRYLGVVDANDQPAISIYAQGASTSLRCTVGGSPFLTAATTSTPTTTAPGSPLTIIGTWSGTAAGTSGTISLYNNGILSSASGSIATRGATSIEVGRYNTTYNQNSNSAIKIGAIWNRCLTPQEVQSLTKDPFLFIRSK